MKYFIILFLITIGLLCFDIYRRSENQKSRIYDVSPYRDSISTLQDQIKSRDSVNTQLAVKYSNLEESKTQYKIIYHEKTVFKYLTGKSTAELDSIISSDIN